MAAPNTNTTSFDAIVSSTLHDYLSKNFSDQIFTGLKLISWMMSNGRKTLEDGGDFLVEPLMYAKNGTTKWMGPYDTVDTSPQDGFTSAQFNWKELGGSVTFSHREKAMNSGKAQIINLLDAKVKQLQMSLRDKFNTSLYNDGTADLNNELTGLAAVVSASGTYGGISRSTYTWWQAYVESTAGPLTEDDMRIAFNSVSKNLTEPKIIVTTQTLYQKYESLILPAYRTQDLKVGDLGIRALQFKGVPIIWEDACPSGVMLLLNDEYLKLRVHKDYDMVATERREPINQFVFTSLIHWLGNLTCSNCRFQGKLTARTA